MSLFNKKYFFVYLIALYQFYVGIEVGKPFYFIMGVGLLILPGALAQFSASKKSQKEFQQAETDRIIAAIKSK